MELNKLNDVDITKPITNKECLEKFGCTMAEIRTNPNHIAHSIEQYLVRPYTKKAKPALHPDIRKKRRDFRKANVDIIRYKTLKNIGTHFFKLFTQYTKFQGKRKVHKRGLGLHYLAQLEFDSHIAGTPLPMQLALAARFLWETYTTEFERRLLNKTSNPTSRLHHLLSLIFDCFPFLAKKYYHYFKEVVKGDSILERIVIKRGKTWLARKCEVVENNPLGVDMGTLFALHEYLEQDFEPVEFELDIPHLSPNWVKTILRKPIYVIAYVVNNVLPNFYYWVEEYNSKLAGELRKYLSLKRLKELELLKNFKDTEYDVYFEEAKAQEIIKESLENALSENKGDYVLC